MKVSLCYAYGPINWAALPELPARLARHQITIERTSVMLQCYPEEFGHDSLETASAAVAAGFQPSRYHIHVDGTLAKQRISLSISRFVNVHNERVQIIDLTGSIDRSIVQSVADFLGLVPDTITSTKTVPDRSVFIAHRFDELGSACAEKVSRLFELLDFSVLSGRGFAPTSVADKVKSRLLTQALVVAILTPGDDATWLIQESVLADARAKPLFVLRDQDTAFKPALLSDLEYIPFRAPIVETAFIPLLEGLRELKYFTRSA